jgi:hypothetical protein
MAKKTYDLVGWQNESTGNTPVSADNLKHMDEGIKYLYDEGATSKDIFICGNGQTVEDAPEEAKVVFEKNAINTKASEVINSMSGNQTDLAPSVNTVKKYVNGVVLYEGEETTIENPITLNDDVSNYDEIEIITEKGYSIKSTKVPVSYGKAGVIHGFVTNETFAQISVRNFTFSGNKLNTNNSGGINLGQTSNTIYTDVEVRVKKVIGYKKEVS